ncbi:MAG: phage tail tube protein [Pseudoruegeria sp.]
MSELGVLGYGSIVRIGVGTGPAWTSLELVGDIDMPDEEVDEVDVTHMASPGRRKQFIPGLTDSGDVSIPVSHVPGSDTDVLLKSLRDSREIVLIEITASDHTDAEAEIFSGFLKSLPHAVPIGDKMTATPTFRLNERVVL